MLLLKAALSAAFEAARASPNAALNNTAAERTAMPCGIEARLPAVTLPSPLVCVPWKSDRLTLVVDVPLIKERTLVLANLSEEGEKRLCGESLITRAADLGILAGQAHAGCLLARPRIIPVEWRKFCLLFPGTRWHALYDDDQYIPELYRYEVRWRQNFRHIGHHLGLYDRVVLCS